MKLQKIGYKKQLKDLYTESSNIHISHVPERGRFYISNGVTGYCLTQFGMYSCDQAVSSAGIYNGLLCGFWGDLSDDEIRIELGTVNFGQQGLKSIGNVEFGVDYNSLSGTTKRDLYLSATLNNDLRNDQSGSLAISVPERIVNPLGIGFLRATARDIRIKLRGETYRNAQFNLGYIKTAVQFVDKRNVRGPVGGTQGQENAN